MEEKSDRCEQLETDFDQEIKALISVLAEICIHEFLTQKQKETEDVEQ